MTHVFLGLSFPSGIELLILLVAIVVLLVVWRTIRRRPAPPAPAEDVETTEAGASAPIFEKPDPIDQGALEKPKQDEDDGED